jgi:hypothetical protein
MKIELKAADPKHLQRVTDLMSIRDENVAKLADDKAATEAILGKRIKALETHKEASKAADDHQHILNSAARDKYAGLMEDHKHSEIIRHHNTLLKTAQACKLDSDAADREYQDHLKNVVGRQMQVIAGLEREVLESAYAHELEQSREACRSMLLRLFAVYSLHTDILSHNFEKWLYADLLRLPSQSSVQHGVRAEALGLFEGELKALYLDGDGVADHG